MPFKVAPPIKCVKCDKAVYPNDKQMNYDGLIFHAPCSKCTDCGCNVTVSNFAINDEGGGKKELLCKVHYKARFNAAGGVYAGSGKFTKQSEREVVSAQRASMNATGSSPVKAGTGLEKDTNYVLERSVTTPDKRPSLHMGATGTPKEKEDKPSEISTRRASLKSTGNTKVAAEIAEENSRTASTPKREDEGDSETVFTAAAAAAAHTCTACGTDDCTCGDDCAGKKSGSGCGKCGTDDCTCGDDCAGKKSGSCCGKCGTDDCTCGDDCACKKSSSCTPVTASENLNGDYEGGSSSCDCGDNCSACATDDK